MMQSVLVTGKVLNHSNGLEQQPQFVCHQSPELRKFDKIQWTLPSISVVVDFEAQAVPMESRV